MTSGEGTIEPVESGHSGRMQDHQSGYWILLIAFCSGAASIIYQINWQRELITVFGISHYAVTTIVLAFFFGLALGAWFGKRHIDRQQNAYLFIVALEGIIFLFAFLGPYLFDGIKLLVGQFSFDGGAGSLPAVLTRAGFSILAVIVPTVCMGATLPAFYKAAVRDFSKRTQWIGLVAGFNTYGAVTGSMVTTFVLMGNVRSGSQLMVAASLNGVSILIACVLSRQMKGATESPVTSPVQQQASISSGDSERDRVLLGYCLIGAAGLGLELIWNRIVYLCLDHTVYTFALTLTVYLTGFATGTTSASLLARFIKPSRNSIAIMILLSMGFTGIGLYLYQSGLHVDQFENDHGYFQSAILVTAAYVFLPTFFMGMAMPYIFELLTRQRGTLATDTGELHMVNNIGSILAIFLVGYILIPRTSINLVSLFCFLLLASSMFLIFKPSESRWFPRSVMILLMSAAIGCVIHLHRQTLHAGHIEKFFSKETEYIEDESGLWGLEKVDPRKVVLRLNGYFENQLLIPPKGIFEGDFLVPAMVNPDIRDIYMVGLGLGVGAYEFLKLPEIRSFTAAEISSGSIALSEKTWAPFTNNIFLDQRFRLVREDGRIHLESTDEEFDAVISGTNRSFYAGSTHIYSREYWELVKDHLSPQGVFLQWLPTYSTFSAQCLLKTFLTVFPDALVLKYSHYVYMIGFGQGIPKDFQENLKQAYRKQQRTLESTKLPSADRFLNRLYVVNGILTDESIPINTDDNPVVEYSFRGFESDQSTAFTSIREKYLRPYLE